MKVIDRSGDAVPRIYEARSWPSRTPLATPIWRPRGVATFKVLSVDGGGIRGIIPAHWLTRLEAELKAQKSGSLLDVFDLFAGTSTGSIIAAGLSVGKSAAELCALYEVGGKKIFSKSWLSNPFRYGGGALLPAYSGVGLDELLDKEFQNTRLGDAAKRLLITAFNGGSRTLKLFDSDKPSDKNYLLREVVRRILKRRTGLPYRRR